MDIGTWQGLLTLAAMLGFIGIVRWAWSGARREEFERAARMPIERDGDTP